MRKIVISAICFIILLSIVTACTSNHDQAIQDRDKLSDKTDQAPSDAVNENASLEYLRITDDLGREVVVKSKPQRIVTLTPTFTSMLYETGGQAVGRVSFQSFLGDIPEGAEDIAEVGFNAQVNLEKVVSLKPDLVIGGVRLHDSMVEQLEANNIPIIVLNMTTYEDVKSKLQLFSKLSDDEGKSEAVLQAMEQKIVNLQSKVPANSPKVVIIQVSTREVTLERDNSIAGGAAKLLNVDNLGASLAAMEGRPDKTPFSLEKIMEFDPDLILISTRGSMEDIEPRMKQDMESHPAWSSLRAVKDGQVRFLPQQYFLTNPGVDYADAVEYIGKAVYPEVYGHAE